MAKALAKAQSEMGHASKDAINPHFKSKYADFAAVVDAIRKPLSNNGLSYVQVVSSTKGCVAVTTRLLHISGQSLSGVLTLPVGTESPQAYGSAITYGRRYSLSAMVGLASEEDDDGNAASVAPPATAVNGATALKAKLAASPAPAVTPKPAAPAASPPRARVQIQDVRSNDGPTHKDIEMRFGAGMGKRLSQLSEKDLEWYLGAIQKSADNPEKATFRETNLAEAAVIRAELAYRKQT